MWHPRRGAGTVTEVGTFADGTPKTVVTFENGESHRYRPDNVGGLRRLASGMLTRLGATAQSAQSTLESMAGVVGEFAEDALNTVLGDDEDVPDVCLSQVIGEQRLQAAGNDILKRAERLYESTEHVAIQKDMAISALNLKLSSADEELQADVHFKRSLSQNSDMAFDFVEAMQKAGERAARKKNAEARQGADHARNRGLWQRAFIMTHTPAEPAEASAPEPRRGPMNPTPLDELLRLSSDDLAITSLEEFQDEKETIQGEFQLHDAMDQATEEEIVSPPVSKPWFEVQRRLEQERRLPLDEGSSSPTRDSSGEAVERRAARWAQTVAPSLSRPPHTPMSESDSVWSTEWARSSSESAATLASTCDVGQESATLPHDAGAEAGAAARTQVGRSGCRRRSDNRKIRSLRRSSSSPSAATPSASPGGELPRPAQAWSLLLIE